MLFCQQRESLWGHCAAVACVSVYGLMTSCAVSEAMLSLLYSFLSLFKVWWAVQLLNMFFLSKEAYKITIVVPSWHIVPNVTNHSLHSCTLLSDTDFIKTKHYFVNSREDFKQLAYKSEAFLKPLSKYILFEPIQKKSGSNSVQNIQISWHQKL